jgi:hypothetical protein
MQACVHWADHLCWMQEPPATSYADWEEEQKKLRERNAELFGKVQPREVSASSLLTK